MPDGKISIPGPERFCACARGRSLGLRQRRRPAGCRQLRSCRDRRDYPIHGIDVSKFQGDIDWNAVANSGVKFAWIKATEGGDNADARFQANWNGAKAAGVPRGAYHFVYWCRPPMEEMANFEQNAPVEGDALPPVLDVEATPTSKTCHRHLTQQDAIAEMKVMLDEMERHYGKRPIIYTTVDFYQAILADGAFMDYPIWVRSTKYQPSVKYGPRPWHFWQYQSDGSDRRHPGPRRSRRLFRHAEAVGSFSSRRRIPDCEEPTREAQARRSPPRRRSAAQPPAGGDCRRAARRPAISGATAGRA